MKHTKGEFENNGWHAHELPEKIGYATHEIHFSKDGECVAEVVHGEANAKLIAAAPELLESLIELLNEDRIRTSIKESGKNSIFNNKTLNARNAIQKATL